jgi:transposase
MTNHVGLDVSQKTTTLCIVDGEGHRQWRGECVTSPEQIVQAVLQHAGAGASIGIETGPMTPWLVHELRSRGLDVTCLDAQHARAALRMQLNKTDRNDVDRISPEEVHTLKGFEGVKSLKGIGFDNFAGFFSRRYRENDYLLGRLHALDRLMDIVCDAAGIDLRRDGIDVLALKRRAFERILNAEERHLIHSKELIAAIRSCIADIGAP